MSIQKSQFDDLPLHSRGWVVQELYLSRRIIYFTGLRTYWRCLESRASDCASDIDELWKNESMFGRRDLRLYAKNLDSAGTVWNKLVTNFMRCAFTYKIDRLVAFSGIAEDFLAKFRAWALRQIMQLAFGGARLRTLFVGRPFCPPRDRIHILLLPGAGLP